MVKQKHIYHLLLLLQQQQQQQQQPKRYYSNKFTKYNNNRMVTTRSHATTGSNNNEQKQQIRKATTPTTPLIRLTTTIDTYENSDDVLYKVLSTSKSIAVIGASNKSNRDSYHVVKYLLDTGLFTNGIYPINPTFKENELLHDLLPTYTSINDVFTKNPNLKGIDIYNIFRNSNDAGIVIENDILTNHNKYNIKTIWMQMGIINLEIAMKVQTQFNTKIDIVMNACPVHEIPRLQILENIKITSEEEKH